MAAGTVGYTDTRGGDRDYLGSVAKSIGNRIKQASDMAREERAFAAKKAELGGTSLEEAGIGKGHFFKRALGSRFGGDRIARTRGRFESEPPAGRDPTKNYKQRFRGGFDYTVTNQINELTSNAIVPMSGALTAGMRSVQASVENVSQGLVHVGDSISDLARSQADMARNIMMNGAFQRAFMQYIMRQQSRAGAAREERSIEKSRVGRLSGGDVKGLLTGKGFGGSGGPITKGGGFTALDALSFMSGRTTGALRLAEGGVGAAVKSGQMSARTTMTGGRLGSSAGTAIAQRLGRNPIPKKIVTTGAKSGRTIANTIAKNADPAAIKTAANYVNNIKKSGRQLAQVGDSGAYMAKALEKAGLLSPGGPILTNADVAGNQIINVTARRVDDGTNVAKTIAAMADSGADAKTIAKVVQGSSVGQKVASKGLSKGTAATRLMAKAGGKSLLKKIPVIAGLAGVAFGIGRLFENPPDWIGAGLEIASGLMGATGVGAGLSLGIDGFLLARDMGAVPFAKGGLLTGKRPVNALMGEAGPEIVTPLNDETFLKFGQGFIDAQKANKSQYAKLQAAGLSEYYEKQGGWESFGEAFKGIFEDLKNIIGSSFQNLNPLNMFRGGGGTSGNIDASKIDADSPQAKALIATIREVEGTAHEKGYDTWFGGRKEMKMTDMTLQQVYDEQTRRMNAGETTYNGLKSAAVGVGQFMDPLNQARAMYAARGEAFDPTKIKFDERLQNKLLLDLAARKRGIDVSKTLTKADFDILQKEWAGLGTFHGQTKRTTADSLRIYQENLREAGENKPRVTGTDPTPKDLEWWTNLTEQDTSSLSPQMSPLFSANALNTQSAYAAGGLTLPPIVNNITNNNYTGGASNAGGDNTAGSAFGGSGLDAFNQFFSLASK